MPHHLVRKVELLLVLGALLIVPAAAQAGTIAYSCPKNSAECKGQTFALWLDGSGPGYFDIAFSINTKGFSGNPDSYAFGVEVKNLYDSTGKEIYGSLALVSAPGGTSNWFTETKQLSQSCEGGDKADTACAVWVASGKGYDFNHVGGEILTWVFRIGADTAPDSVGHVKYWYKNASGSKSAGLLSADLPLQRPTSVPESGSTMTLALFGFAFVAAGYRRLGRPV
jgi:hypothetical protein